MTENYNKNNCILFNSIDLDNLQLKDPVMLSNGDKMMYSVNCPLIEIGDGQNMKMVSNTMDAHPAIYPQPETAGEVQYEMIDEKVIKFMDKLKYVCIKQKSPEKKPRFKLLCKYIILEESGDTELFYMGADNELEPYIDIPDSGGHEVAIVIQFVGLLITKFEQCKFKFRVRQKIIGARYGEERIAKIQKSILAMRNNVYLSDSDDE
jgi:hypothetical protein